MPSMVTYQLLRLKTESQVILSRPGWDGHVQLHTNRSSSIHLLLAVVYWLYSYLGVYLGLVLAGIRNFLAYLQFS